MLMLKIYCDNQVLQMLTSAENLQQEGSYIGESVSEVCTFCLAIFILLVMWHLLSGVSGLGSSVLFNISNEMSNFLTLHSLTGSMSATT